MSSLSPPTYNFIVYTSSLQATSKERLSHKSKVISDLEDEIERLQGQLISAPAMETHSEDKENAAPPKKRTERIENRKVESSSPTKSKPDKPTKSNSDKTADLKTSQLITKKVRIHMYTHDTHVCIYNVYNVYTRYEYHDTF